MKLLVAVLFICFLAAVSITRAQGPRGPPGPGPDPPGRPTGQPGTATPGLPTGQPGTRPPSTPGPPTGPPSTPSTPGPDPPGRPTGQPGTATPGLPTGQPGTRPHSTPGPPTGPPSTPGPPTGQPGTPPPDCRNVKCPTPLCANPVTPPGECCPSCENSSCKFEGCVQFPPRLPGAMVRWLPDPCSPCFCAENRTTCGAIGCPGFPGPDPCFGFPLSPVAAKPWQCCPRCDFGVPLTRCARVPARRRTVQLTSGGTNCTTQVVEHECDKVGFRFRGRKFRCQPIFLERQVRLPSMCKPFTRLFHRDVWFCVPRRDDTVVNADGCDLIV